MIRVILPAHLRTLAGIEGILEIEVDEPVTQQAILDRLEELYPMLEGSIRDHITRERRPFIRFFACGQDFSHHPTDHPLPDAIAAGEEPFRIVGAMAGG